MDVNTEEVISYKLISSSFCRIVQATPSTAICEFPILFLLDLWFLQKGGMYVDSSSIYSLHKPPFDLFQLTVNLRSITANH